MKKHTIQLGLLLCTALPFVSSCHQEETRVAKPLLKEEGNETTIHITVCGDVLIEAPNYMAMGENYSFGSYFDQIKPYLTGDLIIGNEEVPLGGEELGIAGADYQFNAPAQIAPQLKELGFDVMTLANNHAYDRDVQGIANTITNLQNVGIQTTGAYAFAKDQRQPLIVERKGVKLAILSYTYDTNAWIPQEKSFAVNKFLNTAHEFDEAHQVMLKEDVKAAKKLADVVIVAMHWGDEFTYALNEQQQEAARFLNTLGVDLIIGNHPHTLQSVAMLENDQGKQTFVIYSLGNFVSGSANVDRASEMFTNMYELGGIIQMDLVYDNKHQIAHIENPKLIPFVNHFTYGYENFALIPFSNYNEELAQQHYQRFFSSSFTYSFLNEQLHQLYDDKISWE